MAKVEVSLLVEVMAVAVVVLGVGKVVGYPAAAGIFRHLRKLSNPCSYDIFGERSLTANILRFYGRIGVRNACCW
ncbi:hypothetical protein PN465_06490 [Nodularia spumigena CS-584]|uniref:hypothetical protein n=1 Tax=Nodularia spumigena TaxID=70799 RepID=UPI0000EACB62|nr:hypothetical protein [Nodularia spumigena]EAW43723.1 hypothetical protein N9414_22168 [Nodularia spumigena CCY9414]MDB9381869.1 hypothetical protein [Nodularia spumigena CS-584]